jgi:hypothetical protein
VRDYHVRSTGGRALQKTALILGVAGLLLTAVGAFVPASGLPRFSTAAVEAPPGSLSDKAPFRDYSWFVGFAPKENPTIAVAAVVVNEPLWQVRAPYLGREALRIYLDRHAKLATKDPGSRLASK